MLYSQGPFCHETGRWEIDTHRDRDDRQSRPKDLLLEEGGADADCVEGVLDQVEAHSAAFWVCFTTVDERALLLRLVEEGQLSLIVAGVAKVGDHLGVHDRVRRRRRREELGEAMVRSGSSIVIATYVAFAVAMNSSATSCSTRI